MSGVKKGNTGRDGVLLQINKVDTVAFQLHLNMKNTL